MPGRAKTDSFLLSTATVMLGAQADLYSLNNSHALGLVKNVTMTSEVSMTALTQGITNDEVFSMKTGDSARIAMEVFEYTAKNLAYAAGLPGAETVASQDATAVTSASIAPAATTLTVAGDVTTDFSAGDWVAIKSGQEDHLHIAQLTSAVFSVETTLTFTGQPTPAGVTIPAGATVYKVNSLIIGGGDKHPTYSCKIVGYTPADEKPIAILLPKVKVTRGMNLAFQSDNFANMPFEIQPYSLVSDDPNFAIFGAKKFQVITP